jgi:adenylate cyclase
LTQQPLTQRLAAILAADVVGYSRLMEADERATVSALDANRGVFRELVAARGGRVVDTAGDSILAIFPSAFGAVEAAIAIQDALREKNEAIPEDRRMRFRLGVNLGDVIEKEDGSVYGSGVNIAARLESLAKPGGIMISEDVHRQVAGKISRHFADAGTHDVKNIAEPVRAFGLENGAEDSALPAHPSLPDKPSIAVLPFDNRSSDPEQEYFADGIAEDLITELSHFDGLLVIARNSTFQFKGQSVDIAEVGRRFGVRYVVEGSVRRAGGRVRISAQLTDVAGASNLWAERYDRDLTDVFAVQDDVTSQIVTALSAELGEAARTQPRRPVTENIDAYDLYLRGRAYVERTTPEANRRACEIFERAIALDDGLAAAFSELSMVKFRDWLFGWDKTPGLLEDALTAANEGIARDNTLAAAHTRFAWAKLWLRDYDTAIRVARHAVTLDGNYAEGHAMLAGILAFSGKPHFEEALASAQVAERLDPYSFTALFHQCVANLVAGKFAEAEAACRVCLHLNPDFPPGHIFLASMLGLMGKDAEARGEADEVRRVTPNMQSIVFRIPFGDTEVTRRLTDGLRKAGFEFAEQA